MSHPTFRGLRVFLWHSSDGRPAARDLYKRLDAEGWIDAWREQAKLHPGQDWDLEIERAAAASHVIIVCLTENSVSNEEYLPWGLRFVLEQADGTPKGTLRIIPVRLEECELPRLLRSWQSVDYFPEANRNQAYERLLAGLRQRAAELSIDAEARNRSQAPYEPAPPGDAVPGSIPSLITAEELEAERLADAAHRKRLSRLDAAWHSASRSSLASGDSVDCALYSPPEVLPETDLLIQVYVYLPDQMEEAARRATTHDAAATPRGSTTLQVDIERGSFLCFDLSLPNATISEPFQSLRWNGKTAYVAFPAKFDGEASGPQVGKLLVSLHDIPIGVIHFLITVSKKPRKNLDDLQTQPTGQSTRYRSAFISYSSRDRAEVLRRVQMLEALGIKYFQDLLKLDPGQHWETEIYRAIDEADLFLLFWSSAAKESAYVRKEIGYAIQRKRGQDEAPPEIIPIVIEGPPAPAPPEELAHLHFSDRILYFLPRQKAVVRDRWTKCPGCGFRFPIYGETWNGRVHLRCGTPIELVEAD